jgi:2-iminobutanoate/2-iminopropanoate deaminase
MPDRRRWAGRRRLWYDRATATGRRLGVAEIVERSQTVVIETERAARPIGPYSQAIRANGFVFVAGEKGIDPRTGKIVPGGIQAETRQTLENIRAILEAAGSSFDRAVQSFVYMVDIGEFAQMNQVYAEYLTVNPPGRTTVGVTALPAGARVEITITALA